MLNSSTMSKKTFGVGARITLAVMSDDYVNIILEALQKVSKKNVVVETDDVSSFVGGNENDVAFFLTNLVAEVASSGKHIFAHILFSRGCPGENVCYPTSQTQNNVKLHEIPKTNISAKAQWSLYPLLDSSENEKKEHMESIYSAIAYSKQKGIYLKSQHYVTTLLGDIAEILDTVTNAWVEVGRTISHVTSHVVFSINSPKEML